MSKTREIKNQETNGNGAEPNDLKTTHQKELKSYKSTMKAFEMTHKRLFPELYKEKAKRA